MSKQTPKKQENQQYLINLICIIACIAILVSYFWLHKEQILQSTSYGNFLAEVLPDFFAALSSVILVYFLLTRKGINPNETIQEAIDENKKLIHTTNQLIHSTNQEVDTSKKQLKISKEIYALLERQNLNYKKLVAHLLGAKPLAKGISKWMLEGFFSRFEPIPRGIRIKDEYLSLYSYILFWEHLAELQKLRKDKNEECFIARVVHSNSIHIWTNEHDKYKDLSIEIYRMKKKFIDNGGIIVRIIIGKDNEASIDCEKAMEEMERCGIEVKYLKKPKGIRLQYDFLLLHDEKFLAKWKSDAHGDTLSECEYIDSEDRDVSRKWQHLFFELKSKGTPITSIPKDREFFITD